MLTIIYQIQIYVQHFFFLIHSKHQYSKTIVTDKIVQKLNYLN